MSELNLTYNLTPGSNENVAHIEQNFSDIETWANGNVSDSSFSSSTGFLSTWKVIRSTASRIGSAVPGSSVNAVGPVNSYFGSSGSSWTNGEIFYLDPADYAIAGKTPVLRIRTIYLCNATPPTSSTSGLYQITGCSGTLGQVTITFGSPVSGSTASSTLAANTRATSVSSEFAIPSAGHYMFGVAVAGSIPANALVSTSFTLQVRWI